MGKMKLYEFQNKEVSAKCERGGLVKAQANEG